MTKSHILVVNTLQRVEVPKGSSISIDALQRKKHGRPIGVKDKNPWKTKSNKETLSLLKPPKEDRPEDDNLNTFSCAPNNHNARIAERLNQNILGNDEDLLDVNIKVFHEFRIY